MSRFTRKAIDDSFMKLLREKSLDKITVKEIIEAAEVNRNTFYYHYEDIYDLLKHVFFQEAERFRENMDSSSSFFQECERAADALTEHKEAILHIYHSEAKDKLTGYLQSAAEHFVGVFVDRAAEGKTLSAAGRRYITIFYSYGIVGVTLQWIDMHMPDYWEELIRTMSESFEATIDRMIDAYVAGHPRECR